MPMLLQSVVLLASTLLLEVGRAPLVLSCLLAYRGHRVATRDLACLFPIAGTRP